jgi:hypothetical protein
MQKDLTQRCDRGEMSQLFRSRRLCAIETSFRWGGRSQLWKPHLCLQIPAIPNGTRDKAPPAQT